MITFDKQIVRDFLRKKLGSNEHEYFNYWSSDFDMLHFTPDECKKYMIILNNFKIGHPTKSEKELRMLLDEYVCELLYNHFPDFAKCTIVFTHPENLGFKEFKLETRVTNKIIGYRRSLNPSKNQILT